MKPLVIPTGWMKRPPVSVVLPDGRSGTNYAGALVALSDTPAREGARPWKSCLIDDAPAAVRRVVLEGPDLYARLERDLPEPCATCHDDGLVTCTKPNHEFCFEEHYEGPAGATRFACAACDGLGDTVVVFDRAFDARLLRALAWVAQDAADVAVELVLVPNERAPGGVIPALIARTTEGPRRQMMLAGKADTPIDVLNLAADGRAVR